jgi:acetate---CoA ligase (ADP-forming)
MISERAGAMKAFFDPAGIAVIGASEGNDKAGARVLVNLEKFGYAGRTYPVTRRHDQLNGLRCYRSIADVPDPVDLAVIAVSALATPDALRDCGRRGVPAAVLFAAGFGGDTEPGERLQDDLRAAKLESGVRVIGPNTVGIRMVQRGVFATFAHDIEGGIVEGSIAVIAQSGGIGVYLGSALLKRRLTGTRYLVDTGNELDVNSADVLDYVRRDPDVSCVGLILEGTNDGRRLAAAVRGCVDEGKPVVFFKIGHSGKATGHIASHTGSLGGSAEVFEAAMRMAGAHIARDERDFMDALVILDAGKHPCGRRLGVVTPSGGYGILTIDAAEQYGMELPEPAIAPSPGQEAALRSGAIANPYDWASQGAAGERTRSTAISWMLGQPNIDAVLLWEAYSMEMPERQELIYSALAENVPSATKPLFVCGIATPEFEARLKAMDIALFDEPMRLVRALSVVAPPPDPTTPGVGPAPHQDMSSPSAGDVIGGRAARQLLSGLSHVTSVEIGTSAQGEACCAQWRRIFLKVESDRHPHKTELGLVRGPLAQSEVAAAFEQILAARAAAGDSAAPIVTQPAISGVELALGARMDPAFGPVVMVATGGIFIELLNDAQFAPAPVSEDEATAMILRLRGAPALLGARGQPKSDVRAVAAALSYLSRFIASAADSYSAIDVNPVIALEEGGGAIAVDVVLFRAEKDQ